jgi:hypothetical protein
MPGKRLALIALLVGPACHEGGGSTELAPLPIGTHNLGHESVDQRFDGRWIVSLLPERTIDRNGDGDGLDLVPVITDATTGRERILPWAASAIELGGGFVSFAVSEANHGGQDLNRDRDALDHVLFIHTLRTGETRNTGIAIDPARLNQRGDLVAGDAEGRLVVAHLASERPRLLDLAAASRPRIDGARVVVEARENGRDRNGDGDGNDVVVVVVDTRLGTERSLGVAIVPQSSSLDGDLLAYRTTEKGQGETDLDGDGDADDEPVEIVDLGSDQRLIVPAPVLAAQLGGDLALLYLAESAGGSPSVDRNGDGDTDDYVFAFLDRLSFTLTETGLAAGNSTQPPVPALAARRAVFCVGEADQGDDLDGDGEADDLVLAHFDGASGRTRVTGLTCEWGYEMLGIDDRHAFFPSPDPLAPGVRRAQALDLVTGDVIPLDRAVTRMRLDGRYLLCTVPEWLEGIDLNGDGLLDSAVLVVVDVQSGGDQNTGVAVASYPPWSDPIRVDDRLLVPTSELLAFEDLNGDGDTVDPVLALVRLR